MTEKLRRCPFCESTDVNVEISIESVAVECGSCGAMGPRYEMRKKVKGIWPKDAAIAAWNGRGLATQ